MRSIERLILSDHFAEVFLNASDSAKDEVVLYIDSLDKAGINKWLYNQVLSEYSDKSIRFLRKRAQCLGVPSYYNLPKASLLSEILKYEELRRSGTGSN